MSKLSVSGPDMEDTVQLNHLASQVENTLSLARDYAHRSVRSDGHWCGELRSNVTITAEYIFLRKALGLNLQADNAAYRRHILSEQNEDGSWGLAPKIPGDVSTTVEAYLALKILGFDTSDSAMQRARRFVLEAGGIAKVRVFTRIFLATFGLFSWDAVPQIPVELVLLPASFFINIYGFASWARGTIAPLLLICHHQPIFSLPNGTSSNNDFLDELWVDATKKTAPYGQPISTLLFQCDLAGVAFTCLDKLLYQLNGLRSIPLLRPFARRKCLQWILERQETTGDWAGIFPPMHGSVLAFVLEGFSLDDDPVRLGIQAIENFAWEDEEGKRIQACVSPVWDTALMSIGLSDAAFPTRDQRIVEKAMTWIRGRQLIVPHGDWRVYRPTLPAGGFSFEYQNTWYPDIDDTAAIILAQIKHDVGSISSESVRISVTWIAGMQNRDGGWAAFDVENNKLFLNKIPFSDMDSLCDTSCADITGRVLEAFGLIIERAPEKSADAAMHILPALPAACARGIEYLASSQEANGSWFGRWGCNYVYGTSHALCGLAYFLNDSRVPPIVRKGVEWLKCQQQPDGGWGESLLSYRASNQSAQCSTPSQTAWALMGLLAHLPPEDPVIERGVTYLVSTSRPEKGIGSSWPQVVYTGTGFPNHFYLGYDYYRHYFPMMALGRYLQGVRRSV
ncbi:hypothetical protein BDW74DRAFT_175082 [Aspergillus multicolor]|uniref:terpene cyclase/mutase family protein n=1 Tax=Aspergillus multicolor TaxID=41759 RepID=UPI003CCCE47D